MEMPLYLPLVPVYWAAPEDAWWSEQQNLEASEDVCTDAGSSVDTDAPRCEEDFQLSNAYDVPETWHKYEDGLWLKCAHLPLLDSCFVENDKGTWRPWGTTADFWRMAEVLDQGIVVVSVPDMSVHILRRDHEEETMALKPGLRYLRCYPCNTGVLVLGDNQRRFAHLEATWRRDDKRIGRPMVETELVMAALRGRDCNHIGFW